MSDWSFLSFELAKRGISSDVEEIVTDDYECDMWRPQPNAKAVTVVLDLAGAAILVGILEDAQEQMFRIDMESDRTTVIEIERQEDVR